MKQLKKTLLTLVALLAVTTGAWADETPLVTINSTGYTTFTSGSKTFDDKVTVTFSNSVSNDGDHWGWYADDTSSLLTVAGINGYTITSCKFYTFEGTAKTGYTVAGESPSVYLSNYKVYTDANQSVDLGKFGISKIEVFGGVAPASSGPEVAWDKDKNSGTFTMPGGNVTLEPDYYPQAALATQPTAINDVPATTDGAIVEAGTVANIGETATAQGTVMYYVSQSALDDAALQALAADQWTADVPTAADLAQGQAYVYYYVRGNDSDTDDEIFSDGDILAANAITARIGAEPTYAVTFADGVNPEPPAEPEWTASPAAGVKKGQTVTVTYTGTKKVIGVKAEKKAAAEGHALSTSAVGEIVGSDGKAYAVADKDNLPEGVTAAGMVAYKNGSNGLVIALADEASTMNWSTANGETGTAAHTPTVTGYSWRLPSMDEWNQMFTANGGTSGTKYEGGLEYPSNTYTGLNTALATAGGDSSKLQEGSDVFYWSSTPWESNYWNVRINNGEAVWMRYAPNNTDHVRAVLAF